MKRISKNWAEFNESLPNAPIDVSHTEWAPSLRTYLPGKGYSVLEIGCSNGRYLASMNGIVDARELVGIDIIACKTPDSVHFVQADACRLPFKDGAFDLVYSMGVLEHFKAADQEDLIKEQSRVLKPGGILMITMPNCTLGSVRFVKTKFLDFFREFRHVAFTPSQIHNELKRSQIGILFERFMGTSLHIGNYYFSGLAPSVRSRIFSEEYMVIGRKVGAS